MAISETGGSEFREQDGSTDGNIKIEEGVGRDKIPISDISFFEVSGGEGEGGRKVKEGGKERRGLGKIV